MSFDTLERSSYEARPRALYEFKLGESSWKYGSGEIDTVVDGVGTFSALVIKDEGFKESGSPDNEDVKISLPRTTAVAMLYRVLAPSQPVFVVMRRYNVGADDAPVVWVGTIKSSKTVGLNEIELTCRVAAASLDRPGLRLGWQRTCPHALYDHRCTVDANAYRVEIPIESLSGSAIFSTAISALAPAAFTGGYIEFPLNGGIERRAIEMQTGPSLGLLEGTTAMTTGLRVTAYPGCARTIEACKKYNNLPNYGGFNYMPGKSPFDGTPVF